MREHIEQRLAELRQEHEAGATMLAGLDDQRAELQQTLMRIGGAMQVLQELLEPDEASQDTGYDESFPDDATAMA